MTVTCTYTEITAIRRVAAVQQLLVDFIDQYGYIALYVLLSAGIIGVPVPDETLMIFVGSLTYPGGPFQYIPALIVMYAGAMTGMTVSYMLGSKVGKPFLYRYGKWIKLTPKRIERTESWFQRYGIWAVFFGYFVPGIRHFTCYFAGVSGIKIYRYLLYAGTGAFVWCTTFLTLGHFIGRNFQDIMRLIHNYVGLCAATIIVLGAVAVYIYWRTKKKKTVKP